MIAMTLAEIAAVVGGEVRDADASTLVTADAFVDSRAVVRGGLHVAVLGERVDGHDYSAGAVAAGAAAALGSRWLDVPCVVVPDPVEALGRLAHHVVSSLPALTVVGITGSQGKTSTKDLIAHLLESDGETIAPPGNLNNEIGVPLTALRATEETRYLVIEMGARGRGHIEYLASMVRPWIGVVLNVGVAHLGEFGSQRDIAVAKGELVEALPADGLAVLNADDPLVAAMSERTVARVTRFGEQADCDVRVSDVGLDPHGFSRFTLSHGDRSAPVTLRLVGLHQALNAAAAAAVALGCGLDLDRVVAGLESATPRSRWRMEVTETDAGLTVVNDAYNASPDSMRAALATLAELGSRHPGARTVAVLGEMRELGDAAAAEHQALGRLAVRLHIDRLVVVGEAARDIHVGAALGGAAADDAVWVPDAAAAVAYVLGVARRGDLVLVKASRAAGLEAVAAALTGEEEGAR